MPIVTLGRRFISQVPSVQRPTIFYDSDLKGFGLLVHPARAQLTADGKDIAVRRNWIVEYRSGDGGRRAAKRRYTIGPASILSPEDARRKAAAILADARLGGDVASERRKTRAAATIAELVPIYREATDDKRKASTNVGYKAYFDIWVIPEIGSLRVHDVSTRDIQQLHSIIGRKYKPTANRVVAVLAHFFRWAEQAGYVEQGQSPVVRIKKFKESGRERFLSSVELSRLGAAIREGETVGIPWKPSQSKHSRKDVSEAVSKINPFAAGALRLLLFTGARLREILHLRWCDVDFQRGLLLLPDSKTGRKVIVLNTPAIVVLSELQALAKKLDGDNLKQLRGLDATYVVRGDVRSKPRADLKRPWELVRHRADLDGVRLHDIRHTYASVGVGDTMGLPIIGKLLGHANPSTTQRYAHLEVDPLRRASDAISGIIAEAMAKPVSANVETIVR